MLAFFFVLIISVYSNPDDSPTPLDEELLSVIYVSTHGDASPDHCYPTYDFQSLWPNGMDRLTPRGWKESYNMGVGIHNRYSGVLKPSLGASDIEIWPTLRALSQSSALSVYDGFLGKNFYSWDTLNEAELKSVIGNTSAININRNLFLAIYHRCPNYAKIKLNGCAYNNDYVKNFTWQFRDRLTSLANYTGLSGTMFGSEFVIYRLISTLFPHKYDNLTFPTWLDGSSEFEKLSETFVQFNPRNCEMSEEWYKRTAGLWVNHVLSTLEQMIMISNTLGAQDLKKINLYHSYGYTIDIVFAILSIEPQLIKPATELIFEVWRSTPTMEINLKIYFKDGVSGIHTLIKHILISDFIALLLPLRNTDVTHVEEFCHIIF